MSRMIAYVRSSPSDPVTGFGRDVLDGFAELSRLHADGWGTAWADRFDGQVRVAGSVAAATPEGWLAQAAPSRARMVYLRFASRGAPATPENGQPFHRDDVCFQHNGLVAPRERALALLTSAERSELRGTTDSEVYFCLVRRALGAEPGFGRPAADPHRLAEAVGAVRANFPEACLNAMLLTPAGLHVVHSAGNAPPPLAAFAARGFAHKDLPPGHDKTYNTLWTTATPHGHLVATTGIDLHGWSPLPPDTVTVFGSHGPQHTTIPR